MQSSLQKLFDQIESQRESILAPIRKLTPEQFRKMPGAGSWSAAEVLSHILAAERLSVMYMSKKIAGIHEASRTGLWEIIKMAVFITSQRLPGLKYKAPKRVVENTLWLTSPEEIERTWKDIRQELRSLLERIPANRVNRMIYKHPIMGYMDARHAVMFFREHIIHHTPQLRRLLTTQL
jgi:uncharacterized damage-inducible protein DinB